MDKLDLKITDIINKIDFKYEILSGDPALAPVVSNVTVGEVPDIANFLSGGEIILSTLLAYSNDHSLIEVFIKQLIKSKASALFVKLGRFVPEIPVKALDVARKKGLLVINVASDVRWTHLIKEIYALKEDKDITEFEETDILKTHLMDALVYKKGWKLFLDRLEDGAGIPVAVFDKLNNLISSSGNFHKSKLVEANSFSDGEQQNNESLSDHNLHPVPIMWKGKKWGDLVLQKKPTSKQLKLVVGAAQLAEVQVAKEKIELDTRNSITNDILEGLRSGNDTQRSSADLKRLGFDPYLGYRVLGVKIMGIDEPGSSVKSQSGAPDDERVVALKYLIASVVEDFMPNFAFIDDSHNIYIMIGADMDKANDQSRSKEADLNALLNEPILEIRSRIENYVGPRSPFGLHILISDYAEDLSQAPAIFKDMDVKFAVIDITGDKGLDEKSVSFLAFLLTLNRGNLDAMINFAKSTLGPIERYDLEHNASLIETLKAFFDSNESIPDTGTMIFAHRHTVRYRLKQIEKLTDLDVNKSTDKLILHLALRINEVSGS